MTDKTPLIAYFSATGNTRKIASAVHASLGSDIVEIKDNINRSGMFGVIKTFIYALFRKKVYISSIDKEISDYELVILGSPTYTSDIAPAIRAFIEQNLGKFNKVAFIGTGGDGTNDIVIKKLEAACGKVPVAQLYVGQDEVDSPATEKKVADFVACLDQAE